MKFYDIVTEPISRAINYKFVERLYTVKSDCSQHPVDNSFIGNIVTYQNMVVGIALQGKTTVLLTESGKLCCY